MWLTVRVDQFWVWCTAAGWIIQKIDYYYYYHYYYVFNCPKLSAPILLLNQLWSPVLRFQVSVCCTFRVMCDVPRIAAFCSESIDWFPGTAAKFFFINLLLLFRWLQLLQVLSHISYFTFVISPYINSCIFFSFLPLIIIIIIISPSATYDSASTLVRRAVNNYRKQILRCSVILVYIKLSTLFSEFRLLACFCFYIAFSFLSHCFCYVCKFFFLVYCVYFFLCCIRVFVLAL